MDNRNQDQQGKWIEYGASYTLVGGIPAKCSACGKNNLRYVHCPSCGAKMDGRDADFEGEYKDHA